MSTKPVTLDPSDPFDAAIIPIVETNRRKRADYAKDGNPFDNFETSSNLMGLDGFGRVRLRCSTSPKNSRGSSRCGRTGEWTTRRTRRCSTHILILRCTASSRCRQGAYDALHARPGVGPSSIGA